VVEAFFLGTDDRYLEVEVGPHGHYLVLQLHGSRNLVRDHVPIPSVSTEISEGMCGGVGLCCLAQHV